MCGAPMAYAAAAAVNSRITMAKRWNGRKMSHGKKNLSRPVKKIRSKPAPSAKRSKKL